MGAAQMMNYAFAALTAMIGGAYMVWKHSDAGDFLVAGIPALFAGVAALLFIPFGRALWLWMDHALHPLTADDRIEAANASAITNSTSGDDKSGT